MTNELKQPENAPVQELEQLLMLAEDTTANIDKLAIALDKFRITTYFSLVIMYVLVGGTYYFALVSSGATKVIIGIAGTVLMLIFLYTLLNRIKRIKIFRREERAEMDIQMRLISLIDDQYRRVKSEGLISTITATTLEIRLRRLDRTDSYHR